MKERDIFIIICILLILSVIKIINNKFIENFENRFEFTNTNAKKLFDISKNNKRIGDELETDAEDVIKLEEAKRELTESRKYPDILKDERVGDAAQDLINDAQKMLGRRR